jgi:Cd2+/Zn2+-exporting ATPase
MRVEGMNCSACAIKVENALKRLPGVADINMSYTTETLSLQLDESRTSREIIENMIRALGYTPIAVGGTISDTVASSIEEELAVCDRPWWQTRKGRTVLGLGGLLAAAFAVSIVKPDLSGWVSAAALVGLLPFARRALIGALSSTPFSIETLMTVAAAGAIAIVAAEEATVVSIDDNQKVGWAQCANLGIKQSSRAPSPMRRWPVGNGEAAVAHRTISASDETHGAD